MEKIMDLITIALTVIILPTILVIIMPLIDKVLTEEVIEQINTTMNNVEYIIGSSGTTILLATIGVIIAMPFIRWFFSFFNGTNENK